MSWLMILSLPICLLKRTHALHFSLISTALLCWSTSISLDEYVRNMQLTFALLLSAVLARAGPQAKSSHLQAELSERSLCFGALLN